MRTTLLSLYMTALVLRAQAFDCALTASGINYDLKPLGGLRTATHTSSTPPTSNEARVLMNLCGGIGDEDGVSDEDRILNHKSSSSDPDRVTAVIPVWPGSLGDDKIWTTPIGKNGEGGLKVYVEGNEYAGLKQHLNMTLICSTSSTDTEPRMNTYAPGTLSMEWATPDACPKDGKSGSSDDSGSGPDSGSGGGGGWGFWGFIKFLFWCMILGLILYFGIGMFYNHQQYSARGWDLVPHRDFWRELPTLGSDLVHHVSTNVRGGGSRGGYNSLG